MTSAMSDLTPANENPWYVLMTLYGEQDGDEVDRDLHDKNRAAWNAWMGQGMSSADRMTAADLDGFELSDVWVSSDRLDNIRARFSQVWAERNSESPDPGPPNPEEMADLSKTSFEHKVVLSEMLIDRIRFTGSTFHESVSFWRSVFLGKALFNSVNFSGDAIFKLGGTVTAGIVSARQRDINSGPYDDFIQTAASINRGNSGGPMFNLAGEVIGINTAIFSPTGGSVGIGFAIPSNLAKPIVGQLLKYGRARRGYLGVRIQTVTDEIAQGLDLPSASGALVTNLSEDGPAARAKLEVGDVILSFDGKPIDEMRSLPRIVAETAVGREVEVVVWRKGGKKTLKATLGEFPEDEPRVASRAPAERPKDATVESLGRDLAAITPDLRKRFNLADDAAGVVVTDVKAGSPAAEKQIRPGDIIRKIGPQQSDIADPSQVAKAVESARKANRDTLLLLVERERGQQFIALKIAKG